MAGLRPVRGSGCRRSLAGRAPSWLYPQARGAPWPGPRWKARSGWVVWPPVLERVPWAPGVGTARLARPRVPGDCVSRVTSRALPARACCRRWAAPACRSTLVGVIRRTVAVEASVFGAEPAVCGIRDCRGCRLWQMATSRPSGAACRRRMGRSAPVTCSCASCGQSWFSFAAASCARSLLRPKTAPSAPKTAASTFFCHKTAASAASAAERRGRWPPQSSATNGGLCSIRSRAARAAVSALARRKRRPLHSSAADGDLCSCCHPLPSLPLL